MPFPAFTGAVVCSSKKIGEPYFCYYRLLPQVAQTCFRTRNLSDSPFLEKGGLRTIHPTCMQLALPSPWCRTPVWLVFSGRTRMQGTTPPGSVQLQDYYIRPEKMGAPRKDLADAIIL